MVVALTVASCSGEEAAVETGEGRLVVTGADGAVALVDPVDGGSEVLAEGGRVEAVVQPTASRDGTTVVWTEAGPGGPAVAVHQNSETRRVPVPAAPFFYLFAPGGDRLAALGNDPDGSGVALIIVDLARGVGDIVDTGQPYFMDWHPDGDRLVAHIGGDVLATVTVDGGRQLLGVEPGTFQAPQVTPAGRVLAVVGAGGVTAAAAAETLTAQVGGGSLALIDAEGESFERLATASSLVSFEMAPTGDRVAYVDGLGGGGTALGPLRVVASDGSSSEMVADAVVAFEWSPGGEHLLFLALDRQEGLVPRVWDGSVAVEHPGFLPTRVFLSQYLPFWFQYARSVTQWSPDGTAFAYAAVGDDGVGRIWVQPLAGERRDLGEGEMVTWAP